MFDILMYLFENMIHNESEIHLDQDQLTEELEGAGFHRDEIYKALAWLERLAALQDENTPTNLTSGAISAVNRVYTYEEQIRLDTDCRGLLIFLEQVNVLDATTREMVIDRVMEIDNKEFELEDLKWVVLMVLFNLPGKEKAYAQIEGLLFDAPQGPLH